MRGIRMRRVGLLTTVLAVGLTLPGQASDLHRSLDGQLNLRPYAATQNKDRANADYWVQQGHQYLKSGSVNQAIASWYQALELFHDARDVEGEGRIYELLGLTYAKYGDYAQADQIFRRSLAIARDNRDYQGEIYALNNIGIILLHYRSVEDAGRTFAEAAQIAKSVNHTLGQGLSLSNLGWVAHLQGRHRDAIAFHEQAKVFRDQAKDLLGSATTSNLLGDSYLAVGDYRGAYIAYRQAQFLAQQTGHRQTEFRALDGMVGAFQGLGQKENLTDALNRRLALSVQENDSMQVLISLKAIAQYHRQKKDINNAMNYYQQALAVAKTVNATHEQDWLLAQISEIRSKKYLAN